MRFCVQLHQLSRGGQARPLPASRARGADPRGGPAGEGPRGGPVRDRCPAGPAGRGRRGQRACRLILGHLLDNAAEASPKDGTVRVTARLVELAPADLPGFLGRPAPGPHVEVRIADQGPGLTDEARRRDVRRAVLHDEVSPPRARASRWCTECFMPTAAASRRTARPGQGTTVRVVFPLAAARVPAVESGRSSGGSVS